MTIPKHERGILGEVFDAAYEGLNTNKTLTTSQRMRQKQFLSLLERQLVIQFTLCAHDVDFQRDILRLYELIGKKEYLKSKRQTQRSVA